MKAEIGKKLKQIHLFEALPDYALEQLEAICQMRTYQAGKTIIEEGQMGTEMFIVYSGAVEIRKLTRAGDNYTVVRLSAEQNIFFGELALIDDDTRSATVIATEDSQFLAIHKDDFLRLGNQYPEIGLPITREIAKILAGRLRKTTGDMLTIFDALVNEIKS